MRHRQFNLPLVISGGVKSFLPASPNSCPPPSLDQVFSFIPPQSLVSLPCFYWFISHIFVSLFLSFSVFTCFCVHYVLLPPSDEILTTMTVRESTTFPGKHFV